MWVMVTQNLIQCRDYVGEFCLWGVIIGGAKSFIAKRWPCRIK